MGASGSTSYHIAPIESRHLGEMEYLALEHGVTSFKIFMFYGGYGLHGKSAAQNEFLMLGPEDRYDIAHFEFIMRSARSIVERRPELADHISVSLRVGRYPQCLHDARRARGQADRIARL
jgi:allantoinase